MTVMGMDLANLVGLRFDHPVVAVNEEGEPETFDPPDEEEELRPVPTLNEWGLIILSAILGIFGLFALRRKQATA